MVATSPKRAVGRPTVLAALAIAVTIATFAVALTSSNRASAEDAEQTVTYAPDAGDVLLNPERGWNDQETPFWRDSAQGVTDMANLRNEGVTVVRLYFLIDEYRTSRIDEEALDLIEANFTAARNAGVKVIPRFAYNFPTDATYATAQDATLAQTLEHIEQLGPILRDNSDVISYMNLGFVGAWGEWHTSSNNHVSDTGARTINASGRQIVDAIFDELPTDRMGVMRYYAYKQQMYGADPLTEAEAHNGSDRSRMGHLNDCFLASDNDWGTYPWQDPVATEAVKTYLSVENQFVPQGGETCNADVDSRADCATALEEVERMRWSSMHNGYHPDVLAGWESEGCYDEIGRRLGYRFSLANGTFPSVVAAGADMEIQLALDNTGYAAPFNPRPVEVILRNQTTGAVTPIAIDVDDADPRTWRPGRHDLDWSVNVPSGLAPGDYSLLLNLPDAAASIAGNPDYSITLANPGLDEADTGYNNLNVTVTVVAPSSGETRIAGMVPSVPVNSASADNILDDDVNTFWSNDGAFTNGFNLGLPGEFTVTRIRYRDEYSRNLLIELDGTEIFNDWTGATSPTAPVFRDLIPSQQVTGRDLRFELNGADGGGLWLVPHDIQVFGIFQRTLPGDANCDGVLTIADALVVAQFTVGSRTEVDSCPVDTGEANLTNSDMNTDGQITISDVVLIAQCVVGLSNAGCPAP